MTDRAIIDAVSCCRPRSILDVGCGEGWLARALNARGMEVCGVEAVPALIVEATRLGAGHFEVLTYHALAGGQLQRGPFDAVVCNFSLLGRESTESLLAALPRYLSDSGHLLVQTLHPVVAGKDRPYRDGWRAGSWTGFAADFNNPAPWYLRTLESWHAMLRRTGLDVIECREPIGSDATAPSSVIFICRPKGTAQAP